MKFPESYSTVDKLNRLQRMVLLHSYIYYEMNDSIITDEYYNSLSHLLAKKVKRYAGTKTFEKTMYAYVFEDFTDGSTGFDLIHKLKKKDLRWLDCIAQQVLKQYYETHRKRKKNGT